MKLKKKFTILTIFFLLYLFTCLVYTFIKWNALSYGEGWGVVAMVGLMSFGIVGLVLDFILKLIIQDKKMFNIISLTIIIIFSFWFYTEVLKDF